MTKTPNGTASPLSLQEVDLVVVGELVGVSVLAIVAVLLFFLNKQ